MGNSHLRACLMWAQCSLPSSQQLYDHVCPQSDVTSSLCTLSPVPLSAHILFFIHFISFRTFFSFFINLSSFTGRIRKMNGFREVHKSNKLMTLLLDTVTNRSQRSDSVISITASVLLHQRAKWIPLSRPA